MKVIECSKVDSLGRQLYCHVITIDRQAALQKKMSIRLHSIQHDKNLQSGKKEDIDVCHTRQHLSSWPISIGTTTHYTQNVTLSIIKSTHPPYANCEEFNIFIDKIISCHSQQIFVASNNCNISVFSEHMSFYCSSVHLTNLDLPPLVHSVTNEVVLGQDLFRAGLVNRVVRQVDGKMIVEIQHHYNTTTPFISTQHEKRL